MTCKHYWVKGNGDQHCPKCGAVEGSVFTEQPTMTQNTREWEKDFDARFTPHIGYHPEGADHGIASDIKDFIAHQLQKAREEERDERHALLQKIYDVLPGKEHRNELARGWGKEGSDYYNGFLQGAETVNEFVCWAILATPDCGVKMSNPEDYPPNT